MNHARLRKFMNESSQQKQYKTMYIIFTVGFYAMILIENTFSHCFPLIV